MRSLIVSCVLTLVGAVAVQAARAQDVALSLVIHPGTGAASIRNETNSNVAIDGYLLTSGESVFNSALWSTLTTNSSYSGWNQGPAAPNRLGEGNLLSSLAIGDGGLVSIGSPYVPFTPTAIGQPEPPVKFEYHVAGGASVVGDVVFAPQNNVVLMVNPANGQASIQNQSQFPVNIDGILITSPMHVLDPDGWIGLGEGGVAGWTMGATHTNRLGEGNLTGSTLLAANGTPMSIGAPINPVMIQDETDLVFEYHIAGGATVTGGVVFTAAAAVAPVAGDYNGNGVVDAADYTVWRDRLGQGNPLPNTDPSDTDGMVTQAEYNFWKSRFGATSESGAGGLGGLSPASSAVPEPSAGLLACVCGLGVIGGKLGRRDCRRARVDRGRRPLTPC